MFTAAEIALWGPEEAFQELKESLPLGWKLLLRMEDRYAVAELHDETANRVWVGSNSDLKILCLDGLGWLMTRNHKPEHPAWKPREHEITLRVPNQQSRDPDPPDLDPAEIAAVYRNRR